MIIEKKPLGSYKIALEDTEDFSAMRISSQKEEPSLAYFLTRLTQPIPLQSRDLRQEEACLFIRCEYHLPSSLLSDL